MAKQEISIDTVYLLFEEIRAELDKLSKVSSTSQPENIINLSPIDDRLASLQEQLKKLTQNDNNTALLAELQDIKRKINNIPQPKSGATKQELEQGLSFVIDKLTRTIQSSAKNTTIVKNKLSTLKACVIFALFTIIACATVYYAERYYSMKKRKEVLEHYYVRYQYIQIKEKATKADIQWLNKTPTDSIATLILELEEKTNQKPKKK